MLIPQEGPNQDLPTLTVCPGLVVLVLELTEVVATVVKVKGKVVVTVAVVQVKVKVVLVAKKGKQGNLVPFFLGIKRKGK